MDPVQSAGVGRIWGRIILLFFLSFININHGFGHDAHGLLFPSRMSCVQSGNGIATVTPQQSAPAPSSAYLPSSLATLGFTAIAPAAQTLVQPVITQQPVLAPAPPLSCQSQTPQGQASETASRQVGSVSFIFLKVSVLFLETEPENERLSFVPFITLSSFAEPERWKAISSLMYAKCVARGSPAERD